MKTALYTPNGALLEPSELTRSPWSPDTTHGGPPSGLLVRALEQIEPLDLAIARVTVEMLAPIPMVPVTAHATVVRPGRRVQLLAAELSDPEGAVLMRAHAWRIRRRDPLDLPSVEPPPPPPPPPDQCPKETYRAVDAVNFYTDAQERRSVRGSIAEVGAGYEWFRLMVPLVAGERPSPLQRVVIAADNANGVSRLADFDRLVFINTDLSVHLARAPVGEWIALDARSHYSPDGRGLSDSALFDTEGFLGRTNQTLYVDEPDR